MVRILWKSDYSSHNYPHFRQHIHTSDTGIEPDNPWYIIFLKAVEHIGCLCFCDGHTASSILCTTVIIGRRWRRWSEKGRSVVAQERRRLWITNTRISEISWPQGGFYKNTGSGFVMRSGVKAGSLFWWSHCAAQISDVMISVRRRGRDRSDPEGSRVLMKCLFYLSTFFSSYLGVQYLAAKKPYPINPPILLQIISVTSKTPMPNANWRSSMVMEAMIGMSHLRLPCL